MTNKEQTISNLKKLKSFHNGSYGADIDSAIEALELLDKLDEIITKQIDISNNQVECQTLRWVLDVMSEMNVETSQGWIPVSEKLPASDEDVLVTNGKEMYIGWINPTDKCWRVDSEGEYFMNDIVAWQPLPKPYEEKRGDLDGSN